MKSKLLFATSVILLAQQAIAQHPAGLLPHAPLSTHHSERFVSGKFASAARTTASGMGSSLVAETDLYYNGLTFVPNDSNYFTYSGARAMESYVAGQNIYPDMAVTVDYNTSTDAYYYAYASEYTYDTTYPNNILTEVNFTGDSAGTGWVPYDKYLNSYNAAGMETSSIYQVPTGSAWVNSSKSSYTYDAAGNVLTNIYATWTGSSWANNYSYTYYYNSANQVIEEQDAQLAPSLAYTYDYKYAYDTAGNELSETGFYWDAATSSWMNSYRYTYTYNSSNEQVTSLYQYWDSSSKVWVNSTYNVTTSFTSGMPATVLNENWDTTKHAWDTASMTTYSYNSYNQYRTITNESWMPGVGWEYQNGDYLGRYYYKTFSLGVNNVSNVGGDATIYPVPAQNVMHIDLKWNEAQAATIVIYDVTGKVMNQIQTPVATSYNVGVTASELPSGMYFVKISGANGSIVKQISVAH
jgi:Secretion system C-terminal sorting domain